MYKIADTMEVLNKTMKDNDYSFDIYFRMAVIEGYMQSDEKIWELYSKMQRTRCSMIKEIPLEMIEHKNEFISLINDIKENGYNLDYPILVNKDGLIIDGAHRMACAVYFGIPRISIYTNDEFFDFIPADYSTDWFIANGLEQCIELGNVEKKKIRRS